jgi:ABC-type Fe3+ transport system substrate-binding protein
MLWSGHKDPSVFQRYQIIDRSDHQEAARKLGDFVVEQEAKAVAAKQAKEQASNAAVAAAVGRIQ